MTTIQKALIANVYPHIDLDLLQEVIDATPNSEVATEILCGIYQDPIVPEKIYCDDNKSNIYICDLFNKWTSVVSYHYFSPKKISAYFPPKVDLETITEENYKSLECDHNLKDARHKYVSLPSIMEKSTNTMELSRWMKLYDKCPIEIFSPDELQTVETVAHVTHQMTNTEVEG